MRRRNTLFLAPGWNDVAVAEIVEAPINVRRSTSRRWERAASDEGGGEVYPMILVLWRGRGWFSNFAADVAEVRWASGTRPKRSWQIIVLY
ncbi:hypothetical protein HN873_067692 [Arachis hypogaea]